MSLFLVNPFRFGIVPTEFASLYESFQDLTVLQKQHFIEWFSGKALDAIWNTTVIAGTSTVSMVDEIDEGLQIEITSATDLDKTSINFNVIRHYSDTSSVIIGVIRRVTANTLRFFGFADRNNRAEAGSSFILSGDDTVKTFVALETRGGASAGSTDTDVAVNTNMTMHKIELTSSDGTLTIDGILKATRSTLLPIVKLQPLLECVSRSAASGKQIRIRYLEAFNT